jgi:Flp pilus assembly protein TadD
MAASGRPAEAYALLEREAGACGSTSGCLLELGRLALETGSVDKALGHVELLVQQQPENLDAWFLLAEARTRSEDTQGARQAYERVLALSPNHPRAREALSALTGSDSGRQTPAPR